MDTSRFNEPGTDGFVLFDFQARYEFKTNSSISFELGRREELIRDDIDPGFVMPVFRIYGWVDVHHPCNPPITAHIRIFIPVEYHEQVVVMSRVIREALSIPMNENCQTTAFYSDDVTVDMPRVCLGMGAGVMARDPSDDEPPRLRNE